MAFWLVQFLQALLVALALGGVAMGLYSYYRYPWHRMNRESRIPVRRMTVEVARHCVSAAFLLFAPVSIGGVLSFIGTMAELGASASGGTPGYTLVERVALALPWNVVVAGGVALAVLLVIVTVLLVVLDVVRVLFGRDDPPEPI